MNSFNVKAVVFDLDGTLYPSYWTYLLGSLFYFRNFGLINHFGRLRKEIRHRDAYLLDRGYVVRSMEKLREIQAEELAVRSGYGRGISGEMLDEVVYEKSELVLRWAKPFRHLADTLSQLRERNFRLAVMSDLPIGNKLKFLGLDKIGWELLMSSEESGYLKPHPAPFLLMLERLGCRPEEVVYVGNSYRYDISGATEAGIRAVHISSKAHKDSAALFTVGGYKNFVEKFLESTAK